MKDYSAMSDDEIASDVLLALGYKMADEGCSYRIFLSDNSRKDTGSKAYSKFKFDPCNNPADAWPIISGNNISLHAPRFNERWMAEFTGSDEDVNDGFDVDYFDYFESRNANPLRAAMIVYLQMNDK